MEINFANEREKLKINAEKAKREIEKRLNRAQKNIIRELTPKQLNVLIAVMGMSTMYAQMYSSLIALVHCGAWVDIILEAKAKDLS